MFPPPKSRPLSDLPNEPEHPTARDLPTTGPPRFLRAGSRQATVVESRETTTDRISNPLRPTGSPPKADDHPTARDDQAISAMDVAAQPQDTMTQPNIHEEHALSDLAGLPLEVLRPEVRMLLSYAAIIGSVFWRPSLKAVFMAGEQRTDIPLSWDTTAIDSRIASALVEVERLGFVRCQPSCLFVGEPEYVFVREGTALGLLGDIAAERRRRLHATVAGWIQTLPIELRAALTGLRAQQLELSGQNADAIRTYIQAGRAAAAHESFHEAAGWLQYGSRLAQLVDPALAAELFMTQARVEQSHGSVRDQLTAADGMLHNAWILGDRTTVALGLAMRAEALLLSGQIESAMRCAEAAREHAAALGDRAARARALNVLADAEFWQGTAGNASRAAHRHCEADELRQSIPSNGDDLERAMGLLRLTAVHLAMAAGAAADNVLHQAKVWIERSNCRRGWVALALGTGDLQFARGDLAAAEASWDQARSEAEPIGAVGLQARLCRRMGLLKFRRRAPGPASELLDQARTLAESLGNRILLAQVLQGRAEAAMRFGDLTAARTDTDTAADIAATSGSLRLQATVLRAQAALTASQPSTAEAAVDMLQKAAVLLESFGDQWELGRTLRHLARQYVRVGRHAEAERANLRADAIEGALVGRPVTSTRT